MCGNVSSFECKECYKANKVGISSLCKECNKTWHRHSSRSSHQPTPILVPREYSKYVTEYGSQYSTEHPPIDKQIMELFAVVCINTSHYVAFVKCGTIPGSEWCFFDSMADRKGELLLLDFIQCLLSIFSLNPKASRRTSCRYTKLKSRRD